MSAKTLSSMKQRDGAADTFAQLLNADCGLKMCAPLPSKGESIIRIIPEVGVDGNLRPMFGGKGAAGDIWTAMAIENVSINLGTAQKYTVINDPSDRPGLNQMSCPFSAAYISLRSKQKKNTYPPGMQTQIDALLAGTVKPGQNFPTGQAVAQAKDMVFVHAVVFKLNGVVLPKPATKQVVRLSATTAESLQIILAKAHAEGIDLFSPKGGRAIVFKPMKQRGNDIVIYDAEIGQPVPLAEEACRKLWMPWDKVLVKFTYDELMLKLISAIGADVAATIFPEDVNRLTKNVALKAAIQPATTAPQTAYTPNAAAPATTPGVAQTLELDLDGPAVDLDGGEQPTQAGGTPAKAQTTGELEQMYKDMLEGDPTLGIN